MTAISLKKRALHLRLREEEKRLDNSVTIQLKKAGVITCLFLCALVSHAQKDWLSAEPAASAYKHALNLQLAASRKLLPEVKTPEQIYVATVTDALELLVTENDTWFEPYERAYENRLEQLEKLNPLTPEALFAMAELRLQWAFVYLKFSHEFDAAWNIRQAYLLVQECKKKYPEFYLIKKPSGLLEIMLGTIPEKYQWITNLLGMEGSIEKGLTELQEIRTKSASLHVETTLLYYLFQGFVLQQPETALLGLDAEVLANPTNPLLLFLSASLAIKNAQSEKALVLLTKLKETTPGIEFVYANYQLGEVYLHKGSYESAISAYRIFLQNYKGLNYVKDAHYKIGICYWLMNSSTEANAAFDKARVSGKETTEADKHAARSLAENTYPNVALSKIRYATDGGYYEVAKQISDDLNENDFRAAKDKVEFTYRKARLLHKLNQVSEAIAFYQKTITQQGDENWYYAPNACLQLGYLLLEQNKSDAARGYFEKALSYKKHEYKNSIDSKAKSALAGLKKKK